jgi:hypothetical protein
MSESMSSLQGREMGSTAENIAAAREADPSGLGHAVRALHLVVPSAELCERLRLAVEDAATRDAKSMEDLRLRVFDFTTALREVGTTPEAVLITLKALINAGSLPPTARSHPDWSGYLLREKMSTWSIEAYFSDPAAKDHPPSEASSP